MDWFKTPRRYLIWFLFFKNQDIKSARIFFCNKYNVSYFTIKLRDTGLNKMEYIFIEFPVSEKNNWK